jgi:predicted amidophosphoribosyltransferase
LISGVPQGPQRLLDGSAMASSLRAFARLASGWLGEAAVHLFPSRCFSCERPLPRVQLLGACTVCWASLSTGPRARCNRCALPLPDGAAGDGPAHGRCARCAIRPLPFDRAVAAVVYDARARRFLLRAKDGQRPEILRPLAGQLAAAVAVSGAADRIDGIVPVPSSPLAHWRRGFNPARELALELARAAGLPLLDGVLRKRRFGGPAMKGLGAPARWAGAGRSIAPRRMVPGARILLVDDVLTTGATAAACAAALRSAGAVEVRVAVWARTPSPGAGFDHSLARRL